MAEHYSMKKAKELFGDSADDAIMKELRQIHSFETYEPLKASDLTWEEKKEALNSLLFVTEKRNGDIKARNVADGSKQRTYEGYDKKDGASPTVLTESVFLIGVIDACERRAQAVIDVANAFLQSHNDKTVLMLLRGKLAEMMVMIDPSLYREHITYSNKGIPMLYVRLNKALYGMLQAALLFYKKLRGWLEDSGFEVNPYDPCVANKIVYGSQMTICWHVDDLKVSHKDEDAVTAFAVIMGKRFGSGTTIKRGKVFDDLGMELDFVSCPGTMIIYMIKYLQKIIQEFPEQLKGTTACPATDCLFKVREEEDRELLSEEMAKQFHRTTAQLLFLCK